MMLHVPLVCARTVEKSSQISFVTLVEQLIIQCDDTVVCIYISFLHLIR